MDLLRTIQDGKGHEMLDLIDKMRGFTGMPPHISLPQIVVVGQESSGKSSVLKALSDIPFEVGRGITTRYPLEIASRRSLSDYTKAVIVSKLSSDEHRTQELRNFEERWRINPIKTPTDLTTVIREAEDIMYFPSGNKEDGFSEDRLKLEFGGPSKDHLTIIDLPGLVGNETAGRTLADKLVKSYLCGDNTIILTVISIDSTQNNNGVYDFGEWDRKRALGVLTKPDKIGGGIPYIRDIVSSICAGNIAAEWHLVRNLDQNEIDGQRVERQEMEDLFFASFSSSQDWHDMQHVQLGIKKLRARLGALLMDRIRANIPTIREQLTSALKHKKLQLMELGEERKTPTQQRQHLVTKASEFNTYVRESLEGSLQSFNGELSKRTLRDNVRKSNEEFADEMWHNGPTWSIVDSQERQEEAVDPMDALKSHPAPLPLVVTLSRFVQFIKKLIDDNPGKALWGTCDPKWVGKIFQQQTRKWDGLVLGYADKVCDEVEIQMTGFIDELVIGDTGRQLLEHVFAPAFNSRRKKLRKKMEELLTPYSGHSPATLSPSYGNTLSELSRQKIQTTDGHPAEQVYRCLASYYGVALNVLLDNIQNLAVENKLLKGLEDIFSPKSVGFMDDAMLEKLAGESAANTERRALLESEIKNFGDYLEEISRALRESQR